MHAAEAESNVGYQQWKKQKRSPSTSENSKPSASKDKGKGRMVTQQNNGFTFGKVFIFTDGCFINKTKAGSIDFYFGMKASHQQTKPIPDAFQFNKSKHQKTAAECDLWDKPYLFLPDIIQAVQHNQTPNPSFNEDFDPDYKKFLPPLIPLIHTGIRQLAISAGALQYPNTTFTEDLSRSCPDHSKEKTASIYNHTLIPIKQSEIIVWTSRNWSPPLSESLLLDSDKEGSSSEAKDNPSDDEDYEKPRIAPQRILCSHHRNHGTTRSKHDIVTIESSASEDDDSAPTTAGSSTLGTSSAVTDNEDEDTNVADMFSSMVTMSNTSITLVTNDPTVRLNLYDMKDFKF
uniref:Uncharacterized protein n=1 Tax=Moniliophthora roreri TaxID=221103 RepID=A0A0W0G1E2_MONRR